MAGVIELEQFISPEPISYKQNESIGWRGQGVLVRRHSMCEGRGEVNVKYTVEKHQVHQQPPENQLPLHSLGFLGKMSKMRLQTSILSI